MVDREGIGDLLADGTKIAAQKSAKDRAYTVHAGGQEPAMHDGRCDPGFNVHYSLEPTPGRHTLGAHLYYEMFQLWKRVKGIPKPAPLFTKNSKFKVTGKGADGRRVQQVHEPGQRRRHVHVRSFHRGQKSSDLRLAERGVGLEPNAPEDYMTVGERIQTLKQAFNVKHGIEPRNNFISSRALGTIPQQEGANKGRSVDIEKLAEGYWGEFGWDAATGKPKEETLRKLGIQ